MSRKKEYQKFLQTAFWKDLSARKREMVRRCEKCKRRENLQSHHIRYPDDWWETKMEDLQVLCRRCHRKEHGLPVKSLYPFMVHRDDLWFSEMLHRISCLQKKLWNGQELRRRDLSFLKLALRAYPPQPDDTCMQFHVGQVFLHQRKVEEWKNRDPNDFWQWAAQCKKRAMAKRFGIH